MISFKKPRPVNKPLLKQNDLTVYIKQNYVIWFVIFFLFCANTTELLTVLSITNSLYSLHSYFFDNETTEIFFKTGCERFSLGGRK